MRAMSSPTVSSSPLQRRTSLLLATALTALATGCAVHPQRPVYSPYGRAGAPVVVTPEPLVFYPEQGQTAGLQDQVTFAAYNVFGRTLKKLGTAGRDHWGSHHATIMMGKAVRAGVIGGLEPKANDYYATPIDSKTGEGRPGAGDIPHTETLPAMGKTLGAVLGVDPAVMDRHGLGGKVVTAALV